MREKAPLQQCNGAFSLKYSIKNKNYQFSTIEKDKSKEQAIK